MLIPSNTSDTYVGRYLQDIEKHLNLQGYSVDSRAKVAGRSGVTHDVDFRVKDPMDKHFIVELVYSDGLIGEEEVVRLFTICLDTDVTGVLLVVHSSLTKKAAKLARLYGIRVLDISSLDRLSSILRELATHS